MHSLRAEPNDTAQAHNPWTSHSNDGNIVSSKNTAWNSCRGHTDSVSSLDGDSVSPRLATGQEDRHMILSPTPPPQSTEPIPASLSMQTAEEPQTDSRIASLKAIFPDFDDAVILSVLESTDNDHDRALDVLLGMNDPSFVPPAVPQSASPNNHFQTVPSIDAQRMSQEALDEQLARRLALEEQEQTSAQAWQPQGMPVEGQSMYQTYQPRRGGSLRSGWGGWGSQPQSQSQSRPQSQPQTSGQGGKDTMIEFQEGFNRIAESGKKTFSSIMTKVRAKMQEFDQGQGWSSGSQNPPSGQAPQQAQASYYAPAQQQGYGQGAYARSYQPPEPVNPQRWTNQSRTSRTSVSPPRSGVSSSAATEPAISESPHQPSFYDPNARGYDLYEDEGEIQFVDRTTRSAAPATPPAAPAVVRSVTPPQTNTTTPPAPETSSPPSYSSPVPPPSHSRPSSISSPPARSFSPTTKPGAPGGVDFSKLGLLPKRPISLVRPQSPPGAGGAGASGVNAPPMAVTHSESTTGSSTDREEPEFVENPFEDPK